MATMACVQLPSSTPNFGMASSYNNFNYSSASSSLASSPAPSYEGINLQQVGEEVEGIVMLSLLKQKLEAFSEVIRTQRRYDSDDADDVLGRGKRRGIPTNIVLNIQSSSGPSSPKRRRSREEEPTDLSSKNSWMENFNVVKRLSQLHESERRQIEVIQMNEWIEQQQGLYNRRMLSEERAELLKMIGIDVDYQDHPSSPDPNWDEDDDEFSSSGKEQSPPLRKKRRSSPPSSMPASPSPHSSPSSLVAMMMKDKRINKPKIPGKKKANLKRNSLHNWVYNQRRLQYEGNLPLHRKKLLDKIGFDWKWVQQKIDEERMNNPDLSNDEPEMEVIPPPPAVETIPSSKSEELWMTRYRELIDFKERHGHYEVPRYVE